MKILLSTLMMGPILDINTRKYFYEEDQDKQIDNSHLQKYSHI